MKIIFLHRNGPLFTVLDQGRVKLGILCMGFSEARHRVAQDPGSTEHV
jgi:hypothetical protein